MKSSDDASLPPAHHGPDGRFRNPWRTGTREVRGLPDLLRWWWQRARSGGLPPVPHPPPPRVTPRFRHPRAPADALTVTWVGQSTFLIQIGGLNVLTDPVWSERASPVPWAGPRRFVPPGIDFDDLPPIDAIVISHDHYDHLDEGTVRRLRDRYGESATWLAPLGHGDWLRRRGVRRSAEMDWWQEQVMEGASGNLVVTALPCRHWTRRAPLSTNRRLWASWALARRGPSSSPGTGENGPSVYFGGDSGYAPLFREIGDRLGPFDATLLPIGAYEPRWFMESAHMNPEEAVRAYRDLGGTGAFVAMHWGTFQLTDEPVLEPPARTREAWSAAGLPGARLHVPAHGETLEILVGRGLRD